MPSRDDLVHFAERGWLLLPRVFDQAACAAMVEALERQARCRRTAGGGKEPVVVENQQFHDQVFLDWFRGPGILAVNRRLLGAKLKFQGANAHISQPHPDREGLRRTLIAPEHLGWHRGIRPKWSVFPDDADPALINCHFLNNITYLRDVEPWDGATAILEGSHRLEGDYASLKERCPVVMPSAPAGSVLVFTESLIHAGVPLLGERPRHALFYGFEPPWWCCWPGTEMPRELVATIADDEIRELVGPAHFGGQFPEAEPAAAAAAATA